VEDQGAVAHAMHYDIRGRDVDSVMVAGENRRGRARAVAERQCE
jgi:hypothetical protein